MILYRGWIRIARGRRGTLRCLTTIAFTLTVFLNLATRARSEPAEGRSSCPTQLVELLNNGRAKVQAGNLLTARQDYYEPLFQDEGLQQCTLDFRLKALREYGDLLVAMAGRKTGDERTKYKQLAADQYLQYLKLYTSSVQLTPLAPPEEQQYPRVVLNAYANMMWDTDDSKSLCDEFNILARRRPDLFDWKAVEKWNKTLGSAHVAGFGEYCKVVLQPDLRISAGIHTDLVSRCHI